MTQPGSDDGARPAASLARHLLRLARPHQWSKSAFVFIGPLYATQAGPGWDWGATVSAVLLTAAAFALASSGCYIFNDIADAEADRAHPRKRHRPIASGAVSPAQARVVAAGLFVAGAMAAAGAGLVNAGAGWWPLILVVVHVVNVLTYSVRLKHMVIVDVMSLSLGFVLRVVAGCAAVGVWPTTWLLNVTLFLSMTLAFGKRLGERQSLGAAAASARAVQQAYSLDLLRMSLVVTGVATLLTYAAYVVTREASYSLGGIPGSGGGFNLLWLTMLPATYGLLRAITLMESGRFDDPTELAVSDRPFQVAAALFVVLTMAIMVWAPQWATSP